MLVYKLYGEFLRFPWDKNLNILTIVHTTLYHSLLTPAHTYTKGHSLNIHIQPLYLPFKIYLIPLCNIDPHFFCTINVNGTQINTKRFSKLWILPKSIRITTFWLPIFPFTLIVLGFKHPIIACKDICGSFFFFQ